MKISYMKAVYITLIFIGGALCGYLVHDFANSAFRTGSAHQVREGFGKFTNPLLECEVASGAINAPKIRFERELEAYVGEVRARPGVRDVSVYYRDLNNGPAFGVDEEEEFSPASLLKVPIYLAFLKHAESEPAILAKEVTFDSLMVQNTVTQNIRPEKHLEPGTAYRAEELLERMIVYSDNDTLNALYPLLPEREYTELFMRLGLSDFSPTNDAYTLSVKEYSTFFRVLYNASFLSQNSSEKALEVLSETTFNSGIRAGVPSEVLISHKFGERDLEDGFVQLHDCGIVYADRTPYLICVMTRGTDPTAITKAIQDISGFVYQKTVQ